MGQLQEAIHLYLAPRRHTALLVAIVAAFLVRPLIGDSGAGPPIFSLAMLILLLLALYNINVDDLVGVRDTLLAQRRRRNIIAWTLAVPAIAQRFVIPFAPSHSLYLSDSILWLLLFVYITWNELRAVLRQRDDLQPNAFSFGTAGPASEQQTIPVLIYFSLTTLSTIGFGDITPITLQARYAAVAEGITGQFYLAILVARLVGMQMSQSAGQIAESKTPDADSKESSA